jgi:hypothetical protein
MKNTMRLAVASMLLCCVMGSAESQTNKTASSSVKPMLPYAIQVERVDAKVEGVPEEFSAAIYENLIEVLTKSGRYQAVLRSGDNRAATTGNLLVLKTSIQKFQEGSETKRAVTTVSGATQVFVHMQATGSDGRSMAEKDVQGGVRFFGTNLRATHTLALNMQKELDAALTGTAKK